jgi:hypothetical protein
VLNRTSIRLLAGLGLALAAVAVLLWVAPSPPAPGATGTFHVEVVGPGGWSFNATVEDANATALSVLQRAAQAAGFALEVRGAGCPGAYVASVAGHGESGGGGWVYRVAPAGGEWGLPPSVSAACCPLRPGDRVQWLWSTEGVLGPPCA